MAAVRLLLAAFAAAAAAETPTDTRVVPVYVMMPLDMVSDEGQLNDPAELRHQLELLRTTNATGVMVDIWWGLVERQPEVYDWTPYLEVAQMLSELGLKMQAIMSFHSCGGNVGDVCNVPLPSWLGSADEWGYVDRSGRVNSEYVSLFHDTLVIPAAGRTPLQMYEGFLRSFSEIFSSYLGSTVAAIGVGLGPAGELRYPSYELSRWTFPGVGEFQSYDRLALASLTAAANATGRPDWAHPPQDAGNYNSMPENAAFFANATAGYRTPYGHFFLSWYSSSLLRHGGDVLRAASRVFDGKGVHLEAKVSGVHWHYAHPSHAAELTAGYYNFGMGSGRDGYLDIARMLHESGAGFCFTCLEMRNREQRSTQCNCAPEELVRQTKHAAYAAGVNYSGENALSRFDSEGFDTIAMNAQAVMGIYSFTYLRLSPTFLLEANLRSFADFVQKLRTISPNSPGRRIAEVPRLI